MKMKILNTLFLLMLAVGIVNGQSFSNTSAITIPNTTTEPATASPYPSSITVSGVSQPILNVSVTINNFSHTFPSDVGIVLQAPNGDSLLLQDAAGSTAMSNITYTLSDSATAILPEESWGAGTYRPANYFAGDSFPAPGPGVNYGNPGPDGSGTATFASVFRGDSANGTWKLFVVDFAADDGGQIAGGWTLTIQAGTATTRRTLFDYDGDGRADYSLFNASNGMWHLLQTTAGYREQQFAASGDKIVPADYDGDGKTDIAVYRPSNGVWYLLQTTAGYREQQFGGADFNPVPSDYDADGRADFALYRPSNGAWYLLQSTNGYREQQFGGPQFQPVFADYDGDKKTDFAVYLPSNGVWYILRSQLGYVDFQFGGPDFKPVVGDYDGDGKADCAVFLPSNGVWYLSRSQAGFTQQQFADPGDKPVPADYDGDGKTDIAVYRPSNGVWYLLRSQSGFTQQQFGGPAFVPTVSAFLP